MSEPDHLDVAPRPLRPRVWVVLVVVACLVLAAVGVIRFRQLSENTGPPPVPSPTSSSTPSPAAPTWPIGLGSGTVYVLGDDGLSQIDLGTGRVQEAGVAQVSADVEMTPAWGGVLIWSEDESVPAELLSRGPIPASAAAFLRRHGFLAGPGLAVWTRAKEEKDDQQWQLVSPAGRILTSARIRGLAIADGSGGLFDQQPYGVRHILPNGETTQWTGGVLATGEDGYVTGRCESGRCETRLVDGGTGPGTVVPDLPNGLDIAALSPSNRFVARTVAVDESEFSPTQVRVTDVGSGRLLRAFPGSADGGALAWLSDRWLMAGNDDGVILYDTEADQLTAPWLSVIGPEQIVVVPG